MPNEKPKQKNSDKRSRNWIAGIIFSGWLFLSAAYLLSQIKPFPIYFVHPTTVITPENAHQVKTIASFEIAYDEGIQFSVDGRYILFATRSGAKLVDVERGKEIWHIEDEASVCATGICDLTRTYFPSNTYMAALSPDGTMLALGIKRGTMDAMQVWDTQTGTIIKSFGSHSGLVALAFSPDNSLLVFSSFGSRECTGLCA
jgi:WD40 repeat protein